MTDVAKTRIYMITIAELVIIIVTMGYKFIVARSTERADGGRLAIILGPAERALILRAMREFVVGPQAIADGPARGDMEAVAIASRVKGTGRAQDLPLTLMGKLPLEFKTLALGVHGEFETIAMDADGIAMPAHTLGQLADALQKRVACHNSYQVKSTQAQLLGR